MGGGGWEGGAKRRNWSPCGSIPGSGCWVVSTLGATQSCKRDALMTAWQEDGVGWDKEGGGGGGRKMIGVAGS